MLSSKKSDNLCSSQNIHSLIKPRKAKSSEILKQPIPKSTRISTKKKTNESLFIDLESDEERPIKSLKRTPTDSEKNAEKIEKIKRDFKDAFQKRKSLKDCSSPQKGSASQTKNMRIPLHDVTPYLY